jgi:hypothetical protein
MHKSMKPDMLFIEVKRPFVVRAQALSMTKLAGLIDSALGDDNQQAAIMYFVAGFHHSGRPAYFRAFFLITLHSHGELWFVCPCCVPAGERGSIGGFIARAARGALTKSSPCVPGYN